MAPLVIDYDVDGGKRVQHKMLGMAARAMAPAPVLRMIGHAMMDVERELFAAEGRGAWAPLSPVTVAMKGHDTILRDSDRLLASLTQEGAEGQLFEVDGDTLRFGTNLTSEDGTYYPGLLKTGTSKMPARDPLPEPRETDMREFTKAIQIWLVGTDRSEFRSGGLGMVGL